MQPGAVGDLVWNDLNRNGLQDAGEPGLAGVTVNLFDANYNLVQTTTTGADGHYQFSGVAPGAGYVIQVEMPANMGPTLQYAGAANADSNLDECGYTDPFTVVSGQTDLTIDGGLVGLCEIGDRVWYDVNRNGLQDAGEAGVADMKVWLMRNGEVCLATWTDEEGNYGFYDLEPGDYTVLFLAPAGYLFTTPNVGGAACDSLDSDATAPLILPLVLTDTLVWNAGVHVVAGEVNTTIDAGIYNPQAPYAPGEAPVVTIEVLDGTASEICYETPDDTGSFRLTRTGDLSQPLSAT